MTENFYIIEIKYQYSLRENVNQTTKENCREEWVMYKRLLAGLLAVTVTMTGISFPDSVFAAQDDTAVIQEEKTGTESSEVTESGETEESEENLTEKTGSDGTETESDEIQAAEIVQTETDNEADITETEEAEELETEDQTDVIKSDISVEGTDSAGTLLAEELANVATQQEENNGCNVFSIDISENTATVYFETTQDATLVVAVYDEKGNQMLACGKKEVTHEETLTIVDIDTGTMPQYFLVRGYLIETETLRPICTEYESSMYTQEMQEFLSKTTYDFDEEKVLNLDEDTTNNFAVYNDDTIIIPESAHSNQVVSVDNTNRVYVIENADETVTSLQEGDIFSHEYGDGDVLIVKVASIKTDGTTVTITGADTSAEEVFDYVKVDSAAGLGTAEIDDSNLEDGVTYEGLADMSDDDDIETYALVDGDVSASTGMSMKINLWTSGEKEKVKITGDVSLKMTTSIKVYIATNYQYFEFRMDYKAKLGIGISGKILDISLKLPSIQIKPLPVIKIGYNPSFEFNADVKCEFSGTIKGTIGMAVSSDDTEIKSLDSTPKVDADLELEGTIFIGFSFEPEISAEIVKVKLASASLEGKIGFESVSKASLVGATDDTIHDCEHCIQGEIFAKGGVSIKVKLLKLEFKYDMLDMKVKAGDWYWSVGKNFGFTTCPYFKYKITVATVDGSGKVLPDSRVDGDFSVITEQGTLANAQFIKTGEDGKAVGYLPEGNYKLKISADGYKTVTKKITVKKDKATNCLRVVMKKSGDAGSNSENQIDAIRPDVGINSYSQVLSLGYFANGVIAQDGSLYMWGYNEWGNIGDGTTEDRDMPTKILDHVISVSSGYDRSGAITQDGSLYMWGCNDEGQIGDGTTENRYKPTKILDHVISVSLGNNHSGAITQDGSLYMWGNNERGNIGDGTTEDRYTPTKITIPGGVARPSNLTSTVSTQSEKASMDSVSISDTALDSTKYEPESESADQPELFEEEEVSVFKADTTETNTATGTQTASFKNLTPNDTYNFYVARSLTADDLLTSDNILDIRQAVAGEDGRMSVTYQPRETDDNAVIFVVGSTQKDLSGAQITIGDTTYNGTAKSVTATVVCDGKTLVEGRDYLVTGGFEITGTGTYTLTIIGTGTYTGTASAAYTVTCQHNYTESITKQPTCTEPGRKTLTCSICGDSQTEEIPAAGHSFSADWTIDEEATCAKEGSKSHHCSVCGAVTDITAIPKTAHTYKNKKVTKRATTSKNGTFTAVCSVCGAEQTEVIYAAKTIKLSKTSMTYNGKKQKPSVTITDAAGKKLKNGTDYKVTYPKKTQNVGKYTVTVTLKGNYTGTVKKTFTILPKNTAISKLTASKNTVTVKWKKQTKQTAGYEIQYSTSSKFTKKTTKTVKVTKNSTTSKKITKLKAKKKYYVRIRTYQTVKVGKKSTKIYSGWSKAKTITTKKS